MIKAFQHNWARSYEWTIGALETGVERKADVVCLQEPPRARGGCGIGRSAYEIRKRKRLWTAIGKGCGVVVDERTDLSRVAHDNVIITNVAIGGEKITRIENVYDRGDTQPGLSKAHKVIWQSVILQGGTVLVGDSTANSS